MYCILHFLHLITFLFFLPESENSLQRHNSLPSQLSFDVMHENYTKGIDIQQVSISGKSILLCYAHIFSSLTIYTQIYRHSHMGSN